MALRLLGRAARWTVGGATAVVGSVYAFDYAESAYWVEKDPWRTARDTRGLKGAQTGHFGWVPTDGSDTSGRRTVLSLPKGPHMPRVVVVGTGWAAVRTLMAIDTTECEVRVVSPRNYFLFTPLLPSVTTGTLSPSAVCTPIRELITYKSQPIWCRAWYMIRGYLPNEVRYYEASVTDVDFDAKVVTCDPVQPHDAVAAAECEHGDGPSRFGIEYDYLVFAVGSTTNTFGTKGVHEHAHFMKDTPDAVSTRTAILDQFERASLPIVAGGVDPNEVRHRMLSFVIVGGGPTGVEVAAEIADLINEDLAGTSLTAVRATGIGRAIYKNALQAQARITLVEASPRLLNGYDQQVADITSDTLAKSGVDVRLNSLVTEVSPGKLKILKRGEKTPEEVPYGVVVWATGVGAWQVTRRLADKLGQDNKRAIQTDDWCRVVDANGNPVDGVLAIGDCATLARSPFIARSDAMFDEVDADKDGTLSKAEFDTALAKLVTVLPHENKYSRKFVQRVTSRAQALLDAGKPLDKAAFRAVLEGADAVTRHLPPTAAVAAQQGAYVASMLSSEAMGRPRFGKPGFEFEYHDRGRLVYAGKNVAVADLPALFGEGQHVIGDEHLTYVLWRAVYWNMLSDHRTKTKAFLQWAMTKAMGRDTCKNETRALTTEEAVKAAPAAK